MNNNDNLHKTVYSHSSEYVLTDHNRNTFHSDNISQVHMNSFTVMMVVYQYHFLDGDCDLVI